MEVGGPDTAVLSAVGNTAANLTGLTVPTLGAFFQARQLTLTRSKTVLQRRVLGCL